MKGIVLPVLRLGGWADNLPGTWGIMTQDCISEFITCKKKSSGQQDFISYTKTVPEGPTVAEPPGRLQIITLPSSGHPDN